MSLHHLQPSKSSNTYTTIHEILILPNDRVLAWTSFCNQCRIPDMIQCRKTWCAATKEQAIFLLLWRWHLSTSWEIVSKDMRQHCSWCILIYYELFFLLAQHYKKLVRVLDYCRILPLLESWGVQKNKHRGRNPSLLFFTDGKPWRMSRPGRGEAASFGGPNKLATFSSCITTSYNPFTTASFDAPWDATLSIISPLADTLQNHTFAEFFAAAMSSWN